MSPPDEPKSPVDSRAARRHAPGYIQADAQTLVQKTSEVMPQAEEAMMQVRQVFKKLDEMMPLLESTMKEYQAIGKAARESSPTSRGPTTNCRSPRGNGPGRRTHGRAPGHQRGQDHQGHQSDRRYPRRVSQTFSDENQKYVTDTLKNVRTSSDRLDGIANNTEDFLKESRETLKRVNGSLLRSEALLEDMQKATQSFGDRSPAILKNVDESTDKLNKTLGDIRDLVQAVARGDGTIQRLLSDPSLYNNINDTANADQQHVAPRQPRPARRGNLRRQTRPPSRTSGHRRRGPSQQRRQGDANPFGDSVALITCNVNDRSP